MTYFGEQGGYYHSTFKGALTRSSFTSSDCGRWLQRWLKWRPWWGNCGGVYMEHQRLFWCVLVIRDTEHKPAIDKANSLVPYSPPSKSPLNAHQRERAAPHTEDPRITHDHCLYAVDWMAEGGSVWVLLWWRGQLYSIGQENLSRCENRSMCGQSRVECRPRVH